MKDKTEPCPPSFILDPLSFLLLLYPQRPVRWTFPSCVNFTISRNLAANRRAPGDEHHGDHLRDASQRRDPPLPAAQPRVGAAGPSRHVGLPARGVDRRPGGRGRGSRWSAPTCTAGRSTSCGGSPRSSASRRSTSSTRTPAARTSSACCCAGSAACPSVATAHSRHIQLHWMFNDRVIAVSEATRRYQRAHNFVRASRIETIHNFIDYRRLAAVPSDARLPHPPVVGASARTTPLLGIVGNVIPRKGLIHLVRAMPTILAAVPDARLLVVGGEEQGKYAASVRGRSAERCGVAGAITWTGYRGDVRRNPGRAWTSTCFPRWKRACRCRSWRRWRRAWRWWPPRWAGFPSASCPARPACWCRPAQSEPLAAAIVELLGDPARRRRLGDAGAAACQEQFTAESQAPSIEAAFARVIRGRAA